MEGLLSVIKEGPQGFFLLFFFSLTMADINVARLPLGKLVTLLTYGPLQTGPHIWL
jgi:hypothetical protein